MALKIQYNLKDIPGNENDNKGDPRSNGEFAFIEGYIHDARAFIAFDVGANVGDYTFNLRNSLKDNFEIHLFEPQPACIDRLKKRFSDERIIMNETAVADHSGTTELHSDSAGSGLASIKNHLYPAHNIALDKATTVKLITLEEYIDARGIKKIDLLKVDVEGGEYDVLRGLGRHLSLVKAIQFEYGSTYTGNTLKQMYELLKDFQIGKLMRDYVDIRKYHPSMENFTYSNYVALRLP